jgi:hypothetical protein
MKNILLGFPAKFIIIFFVGFFCLSKASAQIAFRSSSVTTVASGTTMTGTEPTGAAADDILIMVTYHPYGATNVRPTSRSWQLVYLAGTPYNWPFSVGIYWIRRGTTAPSYALDWSTSSAAEMVVTAWSGAKKYGNPFETKNATATASVNPARPNPPSVTTSTMNSMVIAIGATDLQWNTGGATAPTGYTVATGTGAANKVLGVAYKLKSVPGAEDPSTFTNEKAGTGGWGADTISLLPANPVTFRSKTFVTSSATSSVTLTEPSGAAKNDIMVMVFNTYNGLTGVTPPAGWTQIYSSVTAVTDTYVYWIRRASSAPSYTITFSGTTTYYEGSVTAWSGALQTGSPIGGITTTAGRAINPANPDPPSVTTTTDDSTVIAIGVTWHGYNPGGATPPTGYTLVEGSTDYINIGIAFKDKATAGAENPSAFTNAEGSAEYVFELTFALKPQPEISLVGFSGYFSDSTTTGTVEEPHATKLDDVLILVILHADWRTLTAPTGGWNEIHNTSNGTFRFIVYWIRRTGSAPGYTATLSGAGGLYMYLTSWRNVKNTGSPINASAVESMIQTDPAIPDPPSITTTTSNTAVLTVGWTTEQVDAGGVTHPAGYTAMPLMNDVEWAHSGVSYKILADAGVENPAAYGNFKVPGNDHKASTTVALTPSWAPSNPIRHRVKHED